MSDGPLFILAGNSPYLNRGCEAIVRGTVNILRRQYDNPRFLSISHFNSIEELEDQQKNEIDGSIRHRSTFYLSKKDALARFYRPSTWKYVYRSLNKDKRLGRSVYEEMIPHLPDAESVLAIAADSYSLDHGPPRLFVALDDLVLEREQRLMIWGASVGPFDQRPDYERFMSRHLRGATGIFARESATVDYLDRIGVTENVFRTADPAFAMDAVRPRGIEDELPLDGEAIGLNFSPRLAKYVADNDLDEWTRMVASIITAIAKRTEMPICLIPYAVRSCSDDHGFMKDALALADGTENVALVSPRYNAAELKWIIGRMSVFAGARTHSTIAALSSCVPTLSFAYGIKSQGIHRDIFGHDDFCLEAKDIAATAVADRLSSMLDRKAEVRRELVQRIPGVTGAAFNAGAALRGLLSEAR
jgi:polysaccharide pyruvyl transferase WcaK-like protein